MGKSMRAKRLMAILCDGWIKGSGSSSAKAGMNGGAFASTHSHAHTSFTLRLWQAWTGSAGASSTLTYAAYHLQIKMISTLAECSGFCARRR